MCVVCTTAAAPLCNTGSLQSMTSTVLARPIGKNNSTSQNFTKKIFSMPQNSSASSKLRMHGCNFGILVRLLLRDTHAHTHVSLWRYRGLHPEMQSTRAPCMHLTSQYSLGQQRSVAGQSISARHSVYFDIYCSFWRSIEVYRHNVTNCLDWCRPGGL